MSVGAMNYQIQLQGQFSAWKEHKMGHSEIFQSKFTQRIQYTSVLALRNLEHLSKSGLKPNPAEMSLQTMQSNSN